MKTQTALNITILSKLRAKLREKYWAISWAKVLPILLLACFLSVSLMPLASAKVKSSAWSEIQKWKEISPFWILSQDEQGNGIAIYDLTLSSQQSFIPLGSLDTSQKSHSQMIQILKSARDLFKSGQSQLTSSDLGYFENSDRSEFSEKMQQVDQAIDSLEKLNSSHFDSLKSGTWWRHVRWKNIEVLNDFQPPERFSISDIDFEIFAKDDPDFREAYKKVDLSQLMPLEFVRNLQNEYEITWKNSVRLQSDSDAPVKIADLRCADCLMKENFKKVGIRESLRTFASKIPVPYLSGILGTALHEYFQFEDELILNHQERLLELLREMEEGSDLFKTGLVLSEAERKAALESIFFSRMAFFPSTVAPLDQWKNQEDQALIQAQESVGYLKSTRKEHLLENLNPRFMIERSNKAMNIYSLSANRYWNILPPFVAYDYSDPQRIRNIRIGIEVSHVLVHFLESFIPVPTVGAIIAGAFDWIVETPMHAVQHWEARLFAHLLKRSEVEATKEQWSNELEIINQQGINPMELSFSRQKQVMEEKKKRLP